MPTLSGDTVWHKDGHTLSLELVRDEVSVTMVSCTGGDCQTESGCVVEWFIDRFGLECNVGSCEPTPQIEIAWALIGDARDLDAAQVWVIPVEDPMFSAWAGQFDDVASP